MNVRALLSPERRKWWALAGLALSLLVVGLDLTVLNVALPTLARSLNASTSELQWFANSYNLAMAVMLLPGGLLGDRYGRKKVVLIALAAFGVASGFCAFSDSAGQLIAWRTVLGLGAAVMIPLSMGVLTVLFTPEERPRAIGIWATANMLGIPLGPILGGWLLDHFWWGSVFLINLPVVALALLAVFFLVPESRAEKRPGIDLPGLVTSAVGLATLTYGLIKAGDAGWGSAEALVPIALGVAVLVVFYLMERRPGDTLIDLDLFRARAFAWGSILAAIVSFVLFGLMFTLPQFFQAVEGADALGTGLRLLPMIGGLMVGLKIGQRLLTIMSGRALIALGFAVAAGALVLGATTDVHSSFWFVGGWMALGGAGVGFAMPTTMTAALDELTPDRAGVGSALLMTIRQVGGTVSVAMLGTVLNSAYRSHVNIAHLTAAEAASARRSAGGGVAVAEKLGLTGLLDSVRSALVHATSLTLLASAGFAVIGIVLTTQLPRPKKTDGTGPDAGKIPAPGESTGDLLDALD